MSASPIICDIECSCQHLKHDTKLVVLTGGPGAGKTAVLEMIKKMLCEHVAILPESASIIFGGGFWRLETPTGKAAAQKAIFHIQRDMEELVLNEKKWALGLCDRGTLDGVAYWPSEEETFWSTLRTSKDIEYSRYQAVIHLRAPSETHGYNHQNPLRIETALQAQSIDEKIHRIWSGHPKYHQVESSANFMEKANRAIQLISQELPECCKKGLVEFARAGGTR
ncbi:AAA family ATPase [Bdellovibrio bacteriovorus]|nr:AAA family ATPase [Bdellovibrio bacteriovorus]